MNHMPRRDPGLAPSDAHSFDMSCSGVSCASYYDLLFQWMQENPAQHAQEAATVTSEVSDVTPALVSPTTNDHP